MSDVVCLCLCVCLSASPDLGVVQVEAGAAWLSRGGVCVDAQDEGLLTGCGKHVTTLSVATSEYLQTRAAAVVCPSIPKLIPHM